MSRAVRSAKAAKVAKVAKPASPRLPRDAGMTLAELLVTIGLLAIVSTLVTATTVLTLRATTKSQVRLDDASQGELGVAAVSRALRTAVTPAQLVDQACNGCTPAAIITATGTQLRFYANLDVNGGAPVLVTLRAEQDPSNTRTARLVQDTQPPTTLSDGRYTFCTPGTSGCVVRTRVIGRGLMLPLRDVFTYYDYTGTSLGSGPVSAKALPTLSSVDVTVTVQSRPGDPAHPARTALTRVRLPNVDSGSEDDT